MTEQLTLFAPAIAPKTCEGQRVVTLRDIDEIHQRKEGTAWQNFNSNRKHFVEGTDYYHVTREDQNLKISGFEIGKRGTMVFTLTGYLMIVKSFTDDLSWAIQRELVTGYFAGRRQGKTFMGTPVITLADYCWETGENRSAVKERLRRRYEAGKMPLGSALLLEGKNLRLFLKENPELCCTQRHAYILTREGARKLLESAKPKRLTE